MVWPHEAKVTSDSKSMWSEWMVQKWRAILFTCESWLFVSRLTFHSYCRRRNGKDETRQHVCYSKINLDSQIAKYWWINVETWHCSYTKKCSFLYEHFALLSGLLSQSVMLSLFDMTVVCFYCLFYRGHLLYQMCPPKVNLLLSLWEAAYWCIKKISMFIFPFQDVFKATLTFFNLFFWSTPFNETRLVYCDASSGSINRHAGGAFITSRGSSSTSSTSVTMRAALGGDIIFRKLTWFMHSFFLLWLCQANIFRWEHLPDEWRLKSFGRVILS